MSSDEAEVIEKPVDEQHQRVRASKLEYKTINQVQGIQEVRNFTA